MRRDLSRAVVAVFIVCLTLVPNQSSRAYSSGFSQPDLQLALEPIQVASRANSRAYLPMIRQGLPEVPPPGQYLFVEYWTHKTRSDQCEYVWADIPGYFFYQGGNMTIYSSSPPPPDLVLQPGNLGFWGSGTDVQGKGGGITSHLTKMETFPFSAEMALRDVSASGIITVENQGQLVMLWPDQQWTSLPVTETLSPNCIVTDTVALTNYGWQALSNIVYTPWSNSPAHGN